MLLFVLFMVVLFVFAGLGIDLGFAYVTKARLSKAVDSACLAAVRNISAGTVSAGAIATNAFFANYGVSGRDVAPPVPTITFTTDSINNTIAVEVSATVTINTFFIRVLPTLVPNGPSWKTLTVGSDALATRNSLIMTLVLDVSGSMGSPPPNGSGGGQYLPTAVETFIGNFSDTIDKAAMVKFHEIQENVVFTGVFPSTAQPTQPFRAAISNAVAAFTWSDATFSQGGLTNALVMENNAPPATTNVFKVVVFFTDGLANVVQDTLSCPPAKLVNFGGYDSGTGYNLYDPVTGAQISCGASQFYSQSAGGMVALNRADISADATYRAIQVANDMRANKITVFSIGVGSGINMPFLQSVANDTNAVGYVATGYDGEALVANNPADLASVFQAVASKILLRLSR